MAAVFIVIVFSEACFPQSSRPDISLRLKHDPGPQRTAQLVIRNHSAERLKIDGVINLHFTSNGIRGEKEWARVNLSDLPPRGERTLSLTPPVQTGRWHATLTIVAKPGRIAHGAAWLKSIVLARPVSIGDKVNVYRSPDLNEP